MSPIADFDWHGILRPENDLRSTSRVGGFTSGPDGVWHRLLSLHGNHTASYDGLCGASIPMTVARTAIEEPDSSRCPACFR